jgi:hypothetical protein
MVLGESMQNLFFTKSFFLISLLSIGGFFSACTTPLVSNVYTDNLACTESIVDGALKIAWEDYDANETYKPIFDKARKTYIDYFHDVEFNTFYIVLGVEVEDLNSTKKVKERKYFYYLQKSGDECWAKLYKKDGVNGKISFYVSSPILITLDSYKLDLCNCSDNNIEFGYKP